MEQGFRFLDPPRELRDIVYGVLVADCSEQQKQQKRHGLLEEKRVQLGFGIVFVCKQVSEVFLMAACALSSVVVAMRSADGGLGVNCIGITVCRAMSDITLRSSRRVKVFVDLMGTKGR